MFNSFSICASFSLAQVNLFCIQQTQQQGHQGQTMLRTSSPTASQQHTPPDPPPPQVAHTSTPALASTAPAVSVGTLASAAASARAAPGLRSISKCAVIWCVDVCGCVYVRVGLCACVWVCVRAWQRTSHTPRCDMACGVMWCIVCVWVSTSEPCPIILIVNV